jgi:hypothetical protein
MCYSFLFCIIGLQFLHVCHPIDDEDQVLIFTQQILILLNILISCMCLHLMLSFADPPTTFTVMFPVDLLYIPPNGEECKPRNTMPAYVAEMLDRIESKVGAGSVDLVQGPIIATVLKPTTPSEVSKEVVVGALQALQKVFTATVAADTVASSLPLHDEGSHNLNQIVKDFIRTIGEVVVIGCTHLTTAVGQMYTRLAAETETYETARNIRFVEVKVYIHLTAKEAYAEGTAHNAVQHNVKAVGTHDRFRGILKHYRTIREQEGYEKQGSGSRGGTGKLGIMRAVLGIPNLTKYQANSHNYIWKAATWCERLEYQDEMSTMMDTLDADDKPKGLSKNFFESLIVNMDTEEGVDFIIAVLKEVPYFM